MNDAIETIMSFINENTTTLIFICIFLIVVLCAYLVDNSVKSKKIRKDIEKEKHIIEEENKERESEKNTDMVFETAIMDEKTMDDAIVSLSNLDEEKEIEIEDDNIFTESMLTDSDKEEVDNSIIVQESIIPEVIEEEKPDEVEVLYKNDKKLSEILFDNIEKQPEGKIDDSLTKKDEHITPESETELDAIIRKLNNMENQIDDDQYTNIF